MIEILQHVIIPEAQHRPSIGFQPCRSGGVITDGLVVRMLAAIQLNNQPFIRTGKVNDIASDGNLSSEAKAFQPMGTHRIPELQLRFGHRLAHAFGIGTTLRRNRRMGHGA